MGGGRNTRQNLAEVCDAADFFKQLALQKLIPQDDRINGAVLLVQFHQNIEKNLVISLIKRLAVDDLDDISDHLLVEHHRSDEAALGVDSAGRKSIELTGKRIGELAHAAPSVAVV